MTSTPTWREAETEQFAAAVLAAAEQLDVLPLPVEKDCWACEEINSRVRATPASRRTR